MVEKIEQFIEHLDQTVEKAFDGEKFDVKIQVAGKEIDFTFNADIYENLKSLLLDELDYAGGDKK